MNKNDKIIAIVGVIILIVAAIGVYTWQPSKITEKTSTLDDYLSITSSLSDVPSAIAVSDSDPFLALIATPLAVHYDAEGNQEVIPLYVENLKNPSHAVTRVMDEQIGIPVNLLLDDSQSAEAWSVSLATKYWTHSDAALIIQDDEMGYNLGVMATPLASYLSIPIFVTSGENAQVQAALDALGVKMTVVCGDSVKGYGDVLRFTNIDDIVDTSASFIQEKFGGVEYLTITNPKDAWPPEVLASTSFTLKPMIIPSGASTRISQAILKSGATVLGSFTIPDDYKYALIKFEGINLDAEDVDEFGDFAIFNAGADLPDIPAPLQTYEAFQGLTSSGGIAERDANGNLLVDKVYGETVLYDRGGVTYTVTCKGQWMLKKQGTVMANIVVEKLENPVYEMMKNLSSIAPYLTAYHKGIIFGKPEFAFTVNDNVLTEDGKTSPGFFLPRRNPRITDSANRYFYDVIHKPLNKLLAKLADIELVDDPDIGTLREYYANSPVYIALVGGATVLPNYIYQNYVEPVDYLNGQYAWGVGTPSDVPYGNIDPKPYDWSNLANDTFTEYPYQENIVGRITGWDVQDASALIARSIFYSNIVDNLGEWKDSATVLTGAGLDFQQPPIRFRIAKLTGAAHPGEPMKLWTGFGEITSERSIELMKSLGFKNVYSAYGEAADRQGFSDDAINKLKYNTGILNKFLFFKPQIRRLIGEGSVKGGQMVQDSNLAFMNGHGNMAILAMDGIDLVSAGIGGPISHLLIKKILELTIPYVGPGASLGSHCVYNTREVSNMELGPSFVWLESCITGKIDGMYPQNSLGQSFIHAGVASLIASPTGSNIEGGYLEPKKRQIDTPISVMSSYIKAKLNARKGIYPDPHFGNLIYKDMVNYLKEQDSSIGMAFREARNVYLEQDAGWELWWSPPLFASTGDPIQDAQISNTYSERMANEASQDPYMMKNKYTSYQEYMLFGDPAFVPYIPSS